MDFSVSICQQFVSPSLSVFALIPLVLYMTNSSHLQTRTQSSQELDWHRGTCEWYVSTACRSLVITHKTLRDPLLSHDRFPTMTFSHDRSVHVTPPAKDEVWMLLVRPKSAVEQANVLAPINHTSVVSWMHTNLYVLDLCGRSNLTKIHTSLSSRSRAVINENYLHKRKWAGEKKRGDGDGGGREMTNRWQQTVGERDWEKGDYLIDYVTPPALPWHLTPRLYVLKSKPRQMTNTFIYCSQNYHLEIFSLLEVLGKKTFAFHFKARIPKGAHFHKRCNIFHLCQVICGVIFII